MKLSFYAKPGHCVHWPDRMRVSGRLYQYVGRRFNAETRVHEAIAEPVVVDTEHPDAEHRRVADRLRRVCARDGALWPADETTAAACGVAFVPVERHEGEWQPAEVKPAKRKDKTDG